MTYTEKVMKEFKKDFHKIVHSQDGECGCKYLEDENLCELETSRYEDIESFLKQSLEGLEEEHRKYHEAEIKRITTRIGKICYAKSPNEVKFRSLTDILSQEVKRLESKDE